MGYLKDLGFPILDDYGPQIILLGIPFCFLFFYFCIRCLNKRVPRTHQQILLSGHKRKIVREFRKYLDMLTINMETTFDDALNRVKMVRDADTDGSKRKLSIRRNTVSTDLSNCKEQGLALSMPDICGGGGNPITLLPLDINVVKEILRQQQTEIGKETLNSVKVRQTPESDGTIPEEGEEEDESQQ